MWWQDLFWGFWNGLTAWVILIVHIFGGWPEYPFYDIARNGNWYDVGFLLGAGSPILGALGSGQRKIYIRDRGRIISPDEEIIENLDLSLHH